MENKNIIITGASRGIGRAIALEAISRGYNISVSCIKNSALLGNLVSQAEKHNLKCHTFTGDMGDFNTAHSFISESVRALGSPSALINNAGISHIGLLQDMTESEWSHVINTNIGSVFNCCNAAIPEMLKVKNGHIINISSMWGIVGASCEVAYSASKGAVNSFTKALAKELAPSNISVNAVSCGVIDTDMNKCFSSDDMNSLIEEIPAGRIGQPTDIARVVCDLIESPTYLTGEIISVTGGFI